MTAACSILSRALPTIAGLKPSTNTMRPYIVVICNSTISMRPVGSFQVGPWRGSKTAIPTILGSSASHSARGGSSGAGFVPSRAARFDHCLSKTSHSQPILSPGSEFQPHSNQPHGDQLPGSLPIGCCLTLTSTRRVCSHPTGARQPAHHR